MEELEVKEGKNCFYIGDNDKTPIGIIEYYFKSNNVIIVTHTFVSPEFRGRGLAKKLVDQIVLFAREKSLKILPQCPYVKAVFDQSHRYDDVRYLGIS